MEKEEVYLLLYRKRKREIIESKHIVNKYKILEDYFYFKDILSEEDFIKAKRESKRRYAKRKRCNDKLKQIIIKLYDESNKNKNTILVFGTCTFNDKELERKERTRTKKINKWLNSHFIYSLVNIDYGDKNEREHYHFVGITGEEIESKEVKGKRGKKIYELKNKDYDMGFEPSLEIIKITSEDYFLKKISNYLVKINYHSNKKSSSKRRIRFFKNE